MFDRHPKTALAAYLHGDLAPAERERVRAHLVRCDRCRIDAAADAATLKALAQDAAEIREPDWCAYRAEVYRKIAARRIAARSARRPSWSPRIRWASTAAAGAIAAAIVFFLFIVRQPHPGVPPVDQLAMEDAMGSAEVGMFRNYPMVEHLDLLENYDVIEHLDEISPADTANENRS